MSAGGDRISSSAPGAAEEREREFNRLVADALENHRVTAEQALELLRLGGEADTQQVYVAATTASPDRGQEVQFITVDEFLTGAANGDLPDASLLGIANLEAVSHAAFEEAGIPEMVDLRRQFISWAGSRQDLCIGGFRPLDRTYAVSFCGLGEELIGATITRKHEVDEHGSTTDRMFAGDAEYPFYGFHSFDGERWRRGELDSPDAPGPSGPPPPELVDGLEAALGGLPGIQAVRTISEHGLPLWRLDGATDAFGWPAPEAAAVSQVVFDPFNLGRGGGYGTSSSVDEGNGQAGDVERAISAGEALLQKLESGAGVEPQDLVTFLNLSNAPRVLSLAAGINLRTLELNRTLITHLHGTRLTNMGGRALAAPPQGGDQVFVKFEALDNLLGAAIVMTSSDGSRAQLVLPLPGQPTSFPPSQYRSVIDTAVDYLRHQNAAIDQVLQSNQALKVKASKVWRAIAFGRFAIRDAGM